METLFFISKVYNFIDDYEKQVEAKYYKTLLEFSPAENNFSAGELYAIRHILEIIKREREKYV